MSFLHVTEQMRGASDVVFEIGGKMLAVAATEPAKVPKKDPKELA